MLLSALILGLLGSLHCVGMCGPIAFMLPVDRSNNFKKILQIGSYHLGRILPMPLLEACSESWEKDFTSLDCNNNFLLQLAF